VGDVVVVVFDLGKGPRVLLHQLEDVVVLPLLHVVDILLPPQLKVLSGKPEPVLERRPQLLGFVVEGLPLHGQKGDVAVLEVLDVALVGSITQPQLAPIEALVLGALLAALLSLLVLGVEGGLGVRLERGDVGLVLVEKVLDLGGERKRRGGE